MKSFYLEDIANLTWRTHQVKMNFFNVIPYSTFTMQTRQSRMETNPPKKNLIQLSYAFPDLFPTLLKGGKIPEGTEETASPDPAVTSALDSQAAAPQEPGWKSFQERDYSCIAYILSTKGFFHANLCFRPHKYIKSPHISLKFTFVLQAFKNIKNECLDFFNIILKCKWL